LGKEGGLSLIGGYEGRGRRVRGGGEAVDRGKGGMTTFVLQGDVQVIPTSLRLLSGW